MNNHQTCTCPGHNQGGHSRCDYVTDQVFQDKSYKTNLHLFSAYAGLVWRSVNQNSCSRESIFFWEKVIYGYFYTLFHRYGISFEIHPLFYIMSYEGLCVYRCIITMTVSRKLIPTFSNLISDTKRIEKLMCVFFFFNVELLRKSRKMNLSLDNSQ